MVAKHFERFISLLACASALSIGCGGGQSSEDVASTSTSSELGWERFLASAIITDEGRYIVEGDMAFASEEKLHQYWLEVLSPHSDQALTVSTKTANGATVDNVWSFPTNLGLTYCVRSGFSTNQLAALLPALDEATRAWQTRAGVRFERVSVSGTCDQNNTSVVFDVRSVSGAPYYASAFFPDEPRSARVLSVDDTAFGTIGDGVTLAGMLMHELGHTLGFRHEHIWVSCTGESQSEARQVTDYDEMSVMHYPWCRSPEGGGFGLTELDNTGAIELYGLAPALISVAAQVSFVSQ